MAKVEIKVESVEKAIWMRGGFSLKLVLVSIDLFSYVFARVVFLFCSFFL
jgi:hypothetical protein